MEPLHGSFGRKDKPSRRAPIRPDQPSRTAKLLTWLLSGALVLMGTDVLWERFHKAPAPTPPAALEAPLTGCWVAVYNLENDEGDVARDAIKKAFSAYGATVVSVPVGDMPSFANTFVSGELVMKRGLLSTLHLGIDSNQPGMEHIRTADATVQANEPHTMAELSQAAAWHAVYEIARKRAVALGRPPLNPMPSQ